MTAAKLRADAVNGAKVRDKSLSGADIADGSLSGAQILSGSIEPADLSAAAAHPEVDLPEVLAPGSTERGLYTAQHQSEAIQGPGGMAIFAVISFPIPLTSAPHANYIAKGKPSTANCPGDVDSPQAAPGQVCLYEGEAPNTEFNSFDDGIHNSSSDASRFGIDALFVNKAAGNVLQAYGSWAVTAP